MKATYRNTSISSLCGLFGKTRQSYYKYLGNKQETQVRSDLILSRVREIRQDSHRMGALKLRSILSREMGSSMKGLGRDSFFRLLRENDLLVRCKRRYAVTTQSNHRFKKWPDLVKRSHPSRAEQLWVSDITYVRIKGKWIYLCLITDAFSRKIVGYRLSHRPTSQACIAALRMAISGRMYPERELTHHSDRGIQYCSSSYVKVLQDNGIAISMTESGSPYDNAVAERLNGILKHEYRMAETFPDYGRALAQLVRAVDIYNNFRPHMSCDMLSPQEAHQGWKEETPSKVFRRTSMDEPDRLTTSIRTEIVDDNHIK